MGELSEASLRRALRDAGLPDGHVRYDEATGSTNATALAWARDGAPEWALAAAGHQTAGRGRLGRTWVSRPGQALLFSFVLRPALRPERAVLLTLLAGAAMAEACAGASGREAACKWPNDLLVGEAKVGGILTEAAVAEGRIDHVVVGVGVNLGDPPDIEGAGGLPGTDPVALVAAFLAGFAGPYLGDREDFAGRVLERYRPRCVTLGRRVRATTTDGRTVEGTAVEVDDAGALVVDTGHGPAAVGFGEIEHLR